MSDSGDENDRLPDFGDKIDRTVFEQILEMDEGDDDREFSRSIVVGFFEQAENTFKSMDRCLENRDLHQLSSLGHFLKGSSATLGFIHIKEECEKIQNYGLKKNETGNEDVASDEVCLNNIRRSLDLAKDAFKAVKLVMDDFYQLNHAG